MTTEASTSEIYGGPLHCKPSVFSHIEQGLRKSPHKPAVICMHQDANSLSDLVGLDNKIDHGDHMVDCLKLTYTQLHQRAISLAAGMIENGVKPGSTVLSLMPNGGEYCFLYWTSVIMKMTFAALDPSTLQESNQGTLKHVIKSLKPDIIIIPAIDDTSIVDGLIQDLDRQRPLCICLDAKASDGWKTLRDLIVNGSNSETDEEDFLESLENDYPTRVHSVLFTSGTSAGAPKGAPMRVESISHYLESQSWLINHDNCTRVYQPAHNSRAIAQAVMLQTWKEGGAALLANSSFAIEHTLEAITRHRVSWIVLTPQMVHDLAIILPSLTPGMIDSVRTIQVGGDAVSKEVLLKCAALFPQAKVCVNHGMTEGGGFFLWPFFDTSVANIPFFGDICPIGKVAPGTKLRIWDSETWKPMNRGQPGELHVSCPSIITHYINGVDQSSFYQDGKNTWFITGDVAMVNDEGLVYILGRIKDVIRRSGSLIAPATLEGRLGKFTGTQAVIVALPHPRLGQEPFAVLEDWNTFTEEDVQSEVLRTFGKEYTLRGAASLKQLGFKKFPVNATHKIEKFQVQAAVLKHLQT